MPQPQPELDLGADLKDPASYPPRDQLERECDLVMKGGITSGVVYPRAVCQLATDHRIRSVGGSSAGAIAAGAEASRDLHVPGRELAGIHFAMDFLPQQNKRVAGDRVDHATAILATGKRVVIIGGGDTGADCLGTTHRQGAISVHQFEIMPKPPQTRAASTPWPLWPLQLRTEGAHEEGGMRDWSINSVKFTGDEHGNVKQLHLVRVGPPPRFEVIPGSEHVLEVDLVLLAMGFLGPVRSGMIEQLEYEGFTHAQAVHGARGAGL